MAILSWKEGVIAQVKAVADASGSDTVKAALGETGEHVDLGPGLSMETGQSWINPPQIFEVLLEGMTNYLKPTIREVSSGPYDVVAEDDILEVTANTISIRLPSDGRTIGRRLLIKNKDVSGTTVSALGGKAIDGVAGGPISVPDPWDLLELYWNGSEWLLCNVS